MKSLKQTLWMAFMFLGSLSSSLAFATDKSLVEPDFDWRLQQLGSQSKQERLHCLFQLYWEWRMTAHPDEATYCGYKGQNHRWPDLSLESIYRKYSFINQILHVLEEIDVVSFSEEEQLNYILLKKDIEQELTDARFHSYYLLIDQIQGIHLHAPMIIQMMPTKTVEDYKNIIARLNGFKTLIDQALILLDKGLAEGITPPKSTLFHVPEQILNQITKDPFASPFLEPFKQLPDSIESIDKEKLHQEALHAYHNSVTPSLYKLYTYLMENYIPNSRPSIAFIDLPNGKEWYASRVRAHTTTDLTPQQIHEIGLQEVDRIYQEMQKIPASVGFNGSFPRFLKFLKTDPQFFYSDSRSLLSGYRELTKYIESQLPLLFTQLPRLPYEVVPVPAYCEQSQIGAYYCQGSIVDQRPGCFFINTSFVEKRPKWEMVPLALHEAVPGHHLQIALSQELTHLPNFRKNSSYTAYIEGWGLYAESLGEELGLYQDPYAKFGRLMYEMLRSVRLVVDTGLHTMGWSRQEAIDFFKRYMEMDEQEIKLEIDRYLVMPGQALAYKIGELNIQTLRRLAQQELGPRFDIRLFHHEWLKRGSLPLQIGEQYLKKWIQEQKALPLIEYEEEP